ncbi:MAG: DMT family transporter [Rhodobacteraceae bacterium]|nr:DMT family transporter [Paracoccaceae bacterium]
MNATAWGALAIALWSLLALFTVGAAPVPPLQLNAMCFTIGGLTGAIWLTATGGWSALRDVPVAAYVLGIVGLAGYHLLYFSALRAAPAAEAGLIAYLWPLLIVLFSGLLPGERLRFGHLIGGLLGFLGAASLIGTGLSGGTEALPGYLLALACALTWSGYSVLSRRFKDVQTGAVTVFCLATAALSALGHIVFEASVVPPDATTWAAIAALGLGPVGLAFFVWDIGVKRGDIKLLGVFSYAAPVLSTLVLIGAGLATPTLALLVATALITSGAVVAARASSS